MGHAIPNKWKKHLVLVQFGLKTIEELNNEIHRYDSYNVFNLIKDIRSNLIKYPNTGMYIISSIPANDCFKLPNFCVHNIEELKEFECSLQRDFFDKFSEVWYCKKSFEHGKDNIVGRISFNNRDILDSIKYSQCIEQVWNCSHREIERFNYSSNVIYLRASREGWARHYFIDSVKVPSADLKEKTINGFFDTVKSIENNREKIESFINYLKTIGIDELCLEYMLSSRGFSFIDWDTKDDLKVIDSVFPNKDEYEFLR